MKRYNLMSDYANWHDTGCEVAPACLSCPLPVCRYDDPLAIDKFRITERIPVLKALIAEGMTQKEAAQKMGISRRTVARYLNAVYVEHAGTARPR